MVNAKTRARTAPLGAALAVLALTTLGAVAHAAEHPDLTGTWVLNKRQSDDPARPREERSSRGGGSGVGRQVLRSVSVFGIPVGNLPLPTGREPEPLEADDLPGFEQVLSEVMQIRILQEVGATEFDYGGALTATYAHAGPTVDDDGTSVRAGWNGEVFEVQHELPNGTDVTETYRIDPADRLLWRVRLEQKKADPVVVERVYERDAPK